jgi:hypothetical protein
MRPSGCATPVPVIVTFQCLRPGVQRAGGSLSEGVPSQLRLPMSTIRSVSLPGLRRTRNVKSVHSFQRVSKS